MSTQPGIKAASEQPLEQRDPLVESQKDSANVHYCLAPRAIFTISARIASAISAGPLAPIARPTGA